MKEITVDSHISTRHVFIASVAISCGVLYIISVHQFNTKVT